MRGHGIVVLTWADRQGSVKVGWRVKQKQRGKSVLKGLFSGGFWGLVAGGVTLGAVSLVTEQPAGNAPPAPPQVAAPENVAAPTEGSEPDTTTQDDVAVNASQAPRVVAPQVEITQPMADVEPAAVPQTGSVADALGAPAAQEDAPEIVAAMEEPVLPNPQSVAPQVPAGEQDLTVSTQPAPVPAPIIVQDDPADEVAETQAPAAEMSVVDIPVPMPLPVTDPAPIEEIAIAVPALIAPDTTSSLPAGDSTVKVNRIVADPVEDTAPEEVTEAIPDDAPALVRFGTKFENTDSKPLMAVVLIDDGSMDGAVPALSALPFPVTVVLDPSSPDAPAKMTEYRSAGIEVGVMAALPDGASASNVEVAFEATFAALPETVLMLDAGEGGLQNDRAVTEQAVTLLADAGRGLVTVSKGLNMALRAAEGADLPAVAIYRDLDGEGQDARVIRRFLDQAAFRARQESGVVLLARVRPDTISALILWGTANRAGQVMLAPTSAVLQAAE